MSRDRRSDRIKPGRPRENTRIVVAREIQIGEIREVAS